MERPIPPTRRRAVVVPAPESTTVYIAGSIHAPPRKRASAAAGIYVNTGDSRNRGRCIPAAGEQSQYAAEFFAALEAVRNTDTNTTLTIFSTQEYVREAMNVKLPNWEHEVWVGHPHRDVLRCLAAELKARKASTTFRLAEPGTPGRMMCR
jgi:hypothetical protein